MAASSGRRVPCGRTGVASGQRLIAVPFGICWWLMSYHFADVGVIREVGRQHETGWLVRSPSAGKVVALREALALLNMSAAHPATANPTRASPASSARNGRSHRGRLLTEPAHSLEARTPAVSRVRRRRERGRESPA